MINMTNSLILLLAILGLLMGATLYEQGSTQEEMYNFTEQMTWNESIMPDRTTNYTISNTFTNVVYKGLDFAMYSIIEAGKLFVVYGYNNPDFGIKIGELFMHWLPLIIVILLIWIIAMAWKPTLIIGYLTYLLYGWIKEKWKKRKEKKKSGKKKY